MSYRITQWTTSNVGQVAVRHFADDPIFDLVAVLVHISEKVGQRITHLDLGLVKPHGPVRK
jgi:hypothetical protein